MSTAQQPRNHAEALINFCKKLGIDAAAAPEPLHSYNLRQTLDGKSLKKAEEKDYRALEQAFKESLDLSVSRPVADELGSAVVYIEIKSGQETRTISEGVARIRDEDQLELVITIDKAVLVRSITLDATRNNCVFYLFKNNLFDLLGAPLLLLDKELFPQTTQQPGQAEQAGAVSANDKPTVIVVSDVDLHFSGDMLTIIGENLLVKAFSAKSPDEDKKKEARLDEMLEQIKRYRTGASVTPSLVGQEFKHLTPLHFSGQWETEPEDDTLKKILARHFVNICILYTANRSTFDSDGNPIESVYNSVDRTATLNLKEEPEIAVSTTSLDGLARWFYSGKGTDQRTIFQNIVARALYSEDPKLNYKSFITLIPQLSKEAVWQYQVFVDGKITKHFEELQKVIGYIAEVNRKISEAIDAITKSLTDALLATVGVLVVTVLAALVKKDTSIAIFKISMVVYSLYLLFYALYRMVSIGHSYVLLSNEAKSQLGRYQAALRVDEITDLSSPLRRRRMQFHIWYWLTIALYVGLAVSIWWAGNKGPQILIDKGILTSPSTKITTIIEWSYLHNSGSRNEDLTKLCLKSQSFYVCKL